MSREPTKKNTWPTPDALSALERRIVQALQTGDSSELDVVGYGEISTVVSLEDAGNQFVCKRLPVFESQARLERFAALFDEYLEQLESGGIQPVPSILLSTPSAGGGMSAYCVQPKLDGAELAPDLLRGADAAGGTHLLEAIVQATAAAVTDRVGLDAQLSNWAMVNGTLCYLDLTTPLMRDEGGRDRLDSELFLAALPWCVRGLARVFVLRGITDHYHQVRPALLDLAANLMKEKLENWLPTCLDLINRRVEPPLQEKEVRKYYQGDARLWEILLRLRRLDRLWQRVVRRRPYPFLLPGKIDR